MVYYSDYYPFGSPLTLAANDYRYGYQGNMRRCGSAPVQFWYAQKDNGELVEVKSNGIWGSRKKRKESFTALIGENPPLLERFNKEADFSFDFVRTLIKEYNSSKL